VAGTGARYRRASPPRRLLTAFACPNQPVAGRLEAAIKKLAAIDKKKLVGKSGPEERKALLSDRPLQAHVKRGHLNVCSQAG
jgi:predicted GIY-YIG superfamily endonuclease